MAIERRLVLAALLACVLALGMQPVIAVDPASRHQAHQRLIRQEAIGRSSSSLGQEFRRISQTTDPDFTPWNLDSTRWTASEGVNFSYDASGAVRIPQGGWIQSTVAIVRPTTVEAEIKAAGADAGQVGMTLFQSTDDHSLGTARYSVTTGYLQDTEPDGYRINPGDARGPAVRNNHATGQYDRVKMQLLDEQFRGYITPEGGTDILVEGADLSDSTGWQLNGHVQFVAEHQPMLVRGVSWSRDCSHSAWVAGGCSVSCGNGTRTFSRYLLAAELNGGLCADSRLSKVDTCNKAACTL